MSTLRGLGNLQHCCSALFEAAATCALQRGASSTGCVRTCKILRTGIINALRYYVRMAIQSFRCKDTEALFKGERTRRWNNIASVALRKLAQLHMAGVLEDLRVPPGNRLEALAGDREDQHSIRINDQWRVCFVWADAGPAQVEIVDYH